VYEPTQTSISTDAYKHVLFNARISYFFPIRVHIHPWLFIRGEIVEPKARYEIVEGDGSFCGDIPAIPGEWANASEVFDLKPTSKRPRDSVESRAWRISPNC
jgi:hypothetical protein